MIGLVDCLHQNVIGGGASGQERYSQQDWQFVANHLALPYISAPILFL
jgi:hypothetical protein